VYLSRIKLDKQSRNTRRALISPQLLHAAVENCFHNKDDVKERKLWRIDNFQNNLYLLVLSPGKPDFTQFAKQFCEADVTGETKDYDNLLTMIKSGQRWRFRLRGNAVHSVAEDNETRGKIYAHVTVNYQREWLVKKAAHCGFELDEKLFDVVENDKLRFTRPNQKAPVSISVAVYEGELSVVDAELFRQALTQGIGRAKAYGCGLLTIAKAT